MLTARKSIPQPNIYVAGSAGVPALALEPTNPVQLAQVVPAKPEAIASMRPRDRNVLSDPPGQVFQALGGAEDRFLWGVSIDEDTRQLIGITTLRGLHKVGPEIGFAILNPDYHRRGIGPHIVLGVAACAFEVLNCRRLYADTLAANYAAQAVLQKVGFVRCEFGISHTPSDPYDWPTSWVLPATLKDGARSIPQISAADTARAIGTYSSLRSGVGISFTRPAATNSMHEEDI
jgi:hypothetical protein